MQNPQRWQRREINIPGTASKETPAQQARQAQQPKRGGNRKIGGGLLALSAAAVVSVYTIGYAHTGQSTDQLAAAANTPVATSPAPDTSARTSATVPLTQSPSNSAAAQSNGGSTSTSAQTTQSAYRDGSYSGTGNSRHGSITVSVVVSGGKIASTSITQCGTRYSCAYVQPLMQQVVDRQAVPVSHVSGATDSSSAFRGAVSQALQKALSGA